MIINKTTAKETASKLLEIQAIKLQPNNPFQWASGWRSPIYCDNRIALSYPEVRTFIKNKMANFIRENYPDADVIAGVATGAIGIGALVADELELPFIYVRPQPKSHGRQNKIEGLSRRGEKVVVVEDLISTGGSSLKAVSALREAKLDVLGMVAIFTYGFDVSEANFNSSNVILHTLSNYDNVIERASDINYIKASEMETLKEWRKAPSEWNNN